MKPTACFFALTALACLGQAFAGQPRLLQTLLSPTGDTSPSGSGCLNLATNNPTNEFAADYNDIPSNFGEHVALDGSILAVSSCNKVFIYELEDPTDPRSNYTLSHEFETLKYFNSRLTWEWYPYSLAVHEGDVFVGSAQARSVAEGAGTVYVVRKNAQGVWVNSQRIFPNSGPYTLNYAGFGATLYVSNGVLVVGANAPSRFVGSTNRFDGEATSDSLHVAILEKDPVTLRWEHTITAAEGALYGQFDDAHQGRGLWTNGHISLFTTWAASRDLHLFVKQPDGSWIQDTSGNNIGVPPNSYPTDTALGALMAGTEDGSYFFISHQKTPTYLGTAVDAAGVPSWVDLYHDATGNGSFVLHTSQFANHTASNEGTEFAGNKLAALTNNTWINHKSIDETQILERDLGGPGAWGESFTIPHPGARVQGYGASGTIGVISDALSQQVFIYDIACGNGVLNVELGETCDDGNNVDGDGCWSDCVAETCGNGRIEAGEECDDGSIGGNDACVDCKNAVCGDGVLWEGVEECDDGNSVEGDECSSTCNSTICVVDECPFPARQQCSALASGVCECLPGYTGDTCSSHVAASASGYAAGATFLAGMATLVVMPMARPSVPSAAVATSKDKNSETSDARASTTSQDTESETPSSATQEVKAPLTRSSPALARAMSANRRGSKPSAAAMASATALAATLNATAPEKRPAIKQIARASINTSNLTSRLITTAIVVQFVAFGLDPIFPWTNALVGVVGYFLGLTHLLGILGLELMAPLCLLLALGSLVLGIYTKFGQRPGILGTKASLVLSVLVGAGFIPITRTLSSVLVCTTPVDALEAPVVVADPGIACWTDSHWTLFTMAWAGLAVYFPVALHSTMVLDDRNEDLEIKWTRAARIRLLLAQILMVATITLGVSQVGLVVGAAVMAVVLLLVTVPLIRSLNGLSCSLAPIQYLTMIGYSGALFTVVVALGLSWADDNNLPATAQILSGLFWIAIIGGGSASALYFTSVVSPHVNIPSDKVLAAHPSPWRAWVVAELAQASADVKTARDEFRYADAKKLALKRDSLSEALKEIMVIEKEKVVAKADLEKAILNLAPESETEELVAKIVDYDERLDELFLHRHETTAANSV